MALSPDEKKIYINADTTAGQADGSMYFPVKYLTGLESVTNNTVTLYFRGPNNTTSTSVIVLITTDFIKEFYTQFVNEINFGDKAVITLAVKNLSVSTTQGGSDFVYVNATAGAIIANDDTTAYEDLQIAEDLDVGGNLDVVGTITGDVTGDVTGNADSATLAVSTSALVVADESTDTTCFPVFVTAATGATLAAKSGSNLTFNSNSGLLTATLLAGNLTGDVTGNADTATALATARAINGVDFDGSAPITVTAAGSTLSDTVTVAKGGTGLTTVGTGNILTGNGTGALTSEANLAFSTDRLTIGNGGEDIQPFVRFLNDENTLEIGLSNAADDYVTGSADGDVVINSAGNYNVIIAQNDTAALTINTDGDVVIANTLKVADLDIDGVANALTVESNAGNVAITAISADADCMIRVQDNGTAETNAMGMVATSDDLVIRNDEGNFKVKVANNATEALTLSQAGNLSIIGNLTATTGITLGGHSVNDIDVAGEFVDSDEHLMTSAAINDRIAAAGGGVSVSDSTANTDFPVVFHDESNNLHDDTAAFEYNPSTGNLTVSKINGNTPVIGGKIAVASEAQAPIGMHIARRTITTAEANAMNSTPIEVVPAQGADTIIVPINCLTRVDRAANQTESACDMNAHYADKEPGVYNTASLFHWRRFMFGETTDHSEMRGTTGATSGVTLTESVNKGIELSFDSAATTNCFTSIDIFMTYYIIDIS